MTGLPDGPRSPETKGPRRFSFRQQVMGAVVLLQLGTIIVLTMILLVIPGRNRAQWLRETSKSYAVCIGHACSMVGLDGAMRPEVLRQRLTENIQSHPWEIAYALIQRADGTVVVSSPSGFEGRVLSDGHTRMALHTTQPLILENRPDYPEGLPVGARFEAVMPLDGARVMRLGIAEDWLQREMRRGLWTGLGGIALLLFCGGLLAYLVDRRLRGALRLLSQNAHRIAQGDLSGHVEIRTGDEIEGLSAAFNQMALNLAASRAKLETDHQRLEDEVQRRTRELLQAGKLAAIGEFASGTAHEINNPLGVIGATAERMLDLVGRHCSHCVMGSALEKLPTYAHTIVKHSFRCKGIVQQLLTYARPKELAVRRVDLHKVIEEAIHLVGPQVRLGGKRLLHDRGAPSLSVLTDPDGLLQVILNILNNAIDATPPAGQVTIRGGWGHQGVQVEVLDHGSGISAEHLERVFDPFFTTKPPGQGTGLGLAISKRIIETLGGRISVQSTPGAGTSFQIWIPAAPPLVGATGASG